MKALNKLFFKGLVAIMPVTMTLYLLIWIGIKAEGFFGGIIKGTLGEDLYIPGFGLLLTFIFVILVGAAVGNYITGRVVNFFIAQFEKFPLIKTIYRPIKDLISLFSAGDMDQSLNRVVTLKMNGAQVLGLVTRDSFDDLPIGFAEPDSIAVYIPMAYMIGGFTVVVPRNSVKEVDMPVDKAWRMAITGLIKSKDPSLESLK